MGVPFPREAPRPAPSAEFPFESRFVEIEAPRARGASLRARIHYVETGRGRPILFVHGNPTAAYLWRNVLPFAARHGRAIALDLLGHGLSDKPDVDYAFEEHAAVLAAFVERLRLADLVLVLHDWGGPLGFRLALGRPGLVRAVAAMETFPWRLSWETLPQLGRLAFRAFRTPGLGPFLLQRLDLFTRLVLPLAVADRRTFSQQARARYRSFYPTYASRKALRRWPEQLPLDAETETWQAIGELEHALASWDRPLLWLAARPGAVTTPERLAWLQRTVPQVEIRDLGRGGHFLQEEIPDAIGAALDAWLPRVVG